MANLLIGFDDHGSPVTLARNSLLRHTVVLGSSGSGKTAACKVLVEECVRLGIPVIAIDPQGDIASMALVGDVESAMINGVPSTVAEEFYNKAEVVIWTPGSSGGIPVSIAPSIDLNPSASYEERVQGYGSIATALAGIAGQGRSGAEETAAIFAIALEYADKSGILIENLNDFIALISDPPGDLHKAMEPLVDHRGRLGIAKKIRIKTLGPSRLMFELGNPIDVSCLLGYEPGGARDRGLTRVSVIYLNSLPTAEDKEIFVGSLCGAIYGWMLRNPSSGIQGVVFLDEAADFIPPVRKPASKEALMLLLRQSRKFGLANIISSQHFGGICYQATGNCGNVLLGRSTVRQEAEKIAPLLRSQAGSAAAEIIERLPNLKVGRFVLSSPENFASPVGIRVRPMVSGHGAIDPDGVECLMSEETRERLGP